MKNKALLLCGVLWLGVSTGHCQTILLNSWENSTEGWSIVETNAFKSIGFSNTNGVTQGSYSWRLTTTNVDYGVTLKGPSSANLTLLMMNADHLSMDILPDTNAAPNFVWGIQIDLEVNQPGGVGSVSVSGGFAGGNYPGDVYNPQLGSGQVSTITFPVLQAVRTALDAYPNLPVYLSLSFGGGGGGAVNIDNLRLTKIPQVQSSMFVRELWDDLSGEQIPAKASITNNSSTAGFLATDPWVANPAEKTNCAIMAFRPGFGNDPTVGGNMMGLPGSLDGVSGCMVQENNGFAFFPNATQASFWSGGDFLTRSLDPNNFINFQAVGDYWFTMTIANKPWNGTSGSLDAQYVTFSSSGWGGLGFADGTSTNSDYVAIGVTGLNVYYGPTNVANPWGETNASKALYISQGTLGQPGNINSTVYDPTQDPAANPPDNPATYSQTNFTSGPYHINALASQTVGVLAGDYIVLLGHLHTAGNGTATLDAKYYGTGLGGNSWNTTLDTNPNPASITWDVNYSFNFNGTMTRMLLFENGQFPFYVFGFRAATNLAGVVGLDPGRIAVAPLVDTFQGYPINLTNLSVEANAFSFGPGLLPQNYGPLTYQWYTNGVAIPGATSQNYNIASAALTDAGVYSCVSTDPSGTWGSVSNSVTITVTHLNPPLASVQMLHDGKTFVVTYNEPNLTGVDDPTHYAFNNGITISNLTVINTANNTQVQLTTADLPLGTKISLGIADVTNVVGGVIGTTNFTVWTDMVQPGAANWDAWLCPQNESDNAYFNTFFPNTPYPTILQSKALTSWDGPSSGVTIMGNDGFVGDDFGSRLYGWFIPPVTTNYVFYVAGDDGCRLSLSTNAYPTNLFVIACDSDWSASDQWTNIEDQYPGSPHRGDGTASGPAPAGFVTDNSVASQSPATACLQNRSDQFIVAYYDSTGLPGGPAGATNIWSAAESKVEFCVPPGTAFWPNVDTNGQALIHLEAGKMYYMQLDHVQNGGGYDLGVTYKIAGQPDPGSPSATALTGSVISGTVPFSPTLSISTSNGTQLIKYTGVLLAGTNLSGITNVVGQSSAATAISLGGPSQYTVPKSAVTMFYRTSE